MESINWFEDTINEISDPEKIKEVQFMFNLNQQKARLYLSTFIFTRHENELDSNIRNIAQQLQENFSQERLEKYAIELKKWKYKEVINNSDEFQLTLQDLNQIESPSYEWNTLFDRQRRLVGFAHHYFNSLKQRIENVLEEDHEIVEK
jgi:hypothetical protein